MFWSYFKFTYIAETCQCFSSKSKRTDAVQIIEFTYLRSRKSLTKQRKIFKSYALSIIDYLNQSQTSIDYIDSDVWSLGVNWILYKFFDD